MLKFVSSALVFAIVATGSTAIAQSSELEESTNWSWDQADSQTPRDWYVMIAVEQAIGPAGCDTFRYKVSSVEPMKIKGPPQVRTAHGDEIASRWMMFVAERAPTPYRWLTTSVGHNPPQVYFRETAEEVREAFRKDGHLRNNRSCTGSRLVGLRTSHFEFVAPPGFTSTDFGMEPPPQNVTVSRDLKAAPGKK